MKNGRVNFILENSISLEDIEELGIVFKGCKEFWWYPIFSRDKEEIFDETKTRFEKLIHIWNYIEWAFYVKRSSILIEN